MPVCSGSIRAICASSVASSWVGGLDASSQVRRGRGCLAHRFDRLPCIVECLVQHAIGCAHLPEPFVKEIDCQECVRPCVTRIEFDRSLEEDRPSASALRSSSAGRSRARDIIRSQARGRPPCDPLGAGSLQPPHKRSHDRFQTCPGRRICILIAIETLAHRGGPGSTSCAVMRMRPPNLRTLPSTRY